MEENQPKQPERPASQRVRELAQRGKDELLRPGGIGDGAHGLLRRWFRKVWESRGGGMYALGFAVTFLYLEIVELISEDIPQLFSINILSSDLLEFVISFIVDTLMNTLMAFLWPVTLIQWQWPLGIILLVVGFTIFPTVIQQPLERWIFENQPPPPTKKPKKKRKK
ncbi:MAG: hypothetical protein AAF358_12565 [Pseudomonadota bacterium]